MSTRQCGFMILLTLEVLFLAACSKPAGSPAADSAKAGSPARIKLGYIVKIPEEPWFQQEWKSADQAAAKYGFELIKIGATDGEKVLTALDSLAAAGAQGFAICTPDVRLGPAIVAKANNLGLKMLVEDDEFIGSDGKPMKETWFRGLSAREVGRMVGHELAQEMKRRAWPAADTALCVVSFDELEQARERSDGATEVLLSDGFPREKVFKAPTRTTDQPGSFDAANILLTQHPEVKQWLVCGANDNMVLGAVRAMEGRGLGADQILGVGINGTDCLAEFKKEKPTGFFASVLLYPRHGYEVIELVYKWVHDGIEPPHDSRITGIVINRQNFRKVLAENGLEP